MNNCFDSIIARFNKIADVYVEKYDKGKLMIPRDVAISIVRDTEQNYKKSFCESLSKYEVHQREWNSGNIVAVIFASNSLEECKEFADKWNAMTDKLYEGKNIGDEYCYFANVYNNEFDKYE